MHERRVTPGLLLLSACIFMLLIPGGPIENRAFPGMPFFVALSVSLLATILSIYAVFLVFQTRCCGRRTLHAAAWVGGGFASFYLFDLFEIVPSTTPMGVGVKVFEIVGFAVAVLLIVSVMRDLKRPILEVGGPYGIPRGEVVCLIAFSAYVGTILTFIAAFSMVSHHPGSYIWYGMW